MHEASRSRQTGRWRSGKDPAAVELTQAELHEKAQALDVPGRSKMTRTELLRAVRKAG